MDQRSLDAESSCLGNSPQGGGVPPLPTPDFALFGRIWRDYWPSKHPIVSGDSASQGSSGHLLSAASSGLAVAVPLPDSPPHYAEAGPSTSHSPEDFANPPLVFRRRRPGVRPTLATPPDQSMRRFIELLASSPADMVPPQSDSDNEGSSGQEEEKGEGSLASPWFLSPESPPSLPRISLPQDPSLLLAKSPPSEPADGAGEPSSAAGRAFERAIPLAPLPIDSPLHRRPLPHMSPRNRLSTVHEVMETTAAALRGKGGTSMALWSTLEECSLLIDAQQPWLVDTTFSTPPGSQQRRNEDKSLSAASPSPLSASLLSFVAHEERFKAEEAKKAKEAEVAATAESAEGGTETTPSP